MILCDDDDEGDTHTPCKPFLGMSVTPVTLHFRPYRPRLSTGAVIHEKFHLSKANTNVLRSLGV
jgi:hypothetical protein